MDAAIQERIAHHAATTRKRQSDAMNLDVESVESQLDETIVQLQARVNEHQQALEMVRVVTSAVAPPKMQSKLTLL